MSKNNLKFIKIDPNYIKFLLQFDNKVQYNDNKLKKDNKPFLGVLFTINNYDYYVPLSSANKKKRLIKMHKNYNLNLRMMIIISYYKKNLSFVTKIRNR